MSVTFELFKDAQGTFRYHLIGANGEVIATSEAYQSEQSALNAVQAHEHSATSALVAQAV